MPFLTRPPACAPTRIRLRLCRSSAVSAHPHAQLAPHPTCGRAPPADFGIGAIIVKILNLELAVRVRTFDQSITLSSVLTPGQRPASCFWPPWLRLQRAKWWCVYDPSLRASRLKASKKSKNAAEASRKTPRGRRRHSRLRVESGVYPAQEIRWQDVYNPGS